MYHPYVFHIENKPILLLISFCIIFKFFLKGRIPIYTYDLIMAGWFIALLSCASLTSSFFFFAHFTCLRNCGSPKENQKKVYLWQGAKLGGEGLFWVWERHRHLWVPKKQDFLPYGIFFSRSVAKFRKSWYNERILETWKQHRNQRGCRQEEFIWPRAMSGPVWTDAFARETLFIIWDI